MLWQQAGRTGLIPTHAGKTGRGAGEGPRQRAHPHSRGENRPSSKTVPVVRGSSPLTRGKPVSIHQGAQETRLIPTHAGKTTAHEVKTAQKQAHPHSRGENSDSPTREGLPSGSSPLTRGKHSITGCFTIGERLIPTHAGKTRSRSLTRRGTWAHPHSRGENQVMVRTRVCRVGSSPLTRGKQERQEGSQRPGGLIPTHAGKTSM